MSLYNDFIYEVEDTLKYMMFIFVNGGAIFCSLIFILLDHFILKILFNAGKSDNYFYLFLSESFYTLILQFYFLRAF